MKPDSSDFRLKIKEKSMFQNEQKSEPNLGKNEEQNNFNSKINLSNQI